MDVRDHAAIEALFHPRNVVLVGASDRPDHWAKRVWDLLRRFGYAGRVFPVNPNRREIWGAQCFPNFAALPERPDHLAIFTPPDAALTILRDGAAAGARSATLYAAGFGEGADEAGLRLAADLRSVLHDTGLTIVGPNCMGVACGESGFATVPDEILQELAPGPIAVAAQSGAICASINRAINELGLKIAFLASCGGQIGCKVADFVGYFATRPELRVILCYIEAIPDAARFFEAARRARDNGKTVIVVKIGGSESARSFALAHTGSLAGTSEVFDAFASAAGIIRLLTLEDAIEAIEFLARCDLPRGQNFAAVTNSGALRNLIAEAADRTGAKLVSLSEGTHSKLQEILNQTDITNPLDTKRTIPTAQYSACIDTLVDAEEIDIVLSAEELPFQEGVERRVANLRSLKTISQRASNLGKSLAVMSPFLVSRTDHGRAVRAEIPNVPILRDLERALRVMKALADAGTAPVKPGPFFALPADTELTRRWRARAAACTTPTALNEVESKTLLRAYGIPLPPEEFVQTAAEAEAAARKIGFPVVLKAVSAAVPHKSDAGLVILDIADADALRRATATILERTKALSSPIDGLLVAKQVSGGTETVLGISRDVEMGPVVMFGMGGVLVELFQDVGFAPASLTRDQAAAMVRKTRAGRLLDGYRGSAPGDADVLYDALTGLGRLAQDLSDVIEAVDINPFLVCERGRGAYALDGLVVLRPPAARD